MEQDPLPDAWQSPFWPDSLQCCKTTGIKVLVGCLEIWLLIWTTLEPLSQLDGARSLVLGLWALPPLPQGGGPPLPQVSQPLVSF